MSEIVATVIAALGPAPAPGRLDRRVVLCVACDHAVVDAEVAFGADHPTIVALVAIERGEAPLAHAARAAAATVVLVDAGVAEPGWLPSTVIGVARARGDLALGLAMTEAEVEAGLEAGVALATALVEDGLELLALGALGAGGDLSAAAVIGALVGAGDTLAPADGRALVASGLAALGPMTEPRAVLAAVGGSDVAVLAGAMLTAAARGARIVLDGAVTIAAALVATRLAPALASYLICAHGGGGAAANAGRAALGLTPLVSAGLGVGDGTGAATMLPVIAGA